MLLFLLSACGPEGQAPADNADAMEWYLPAPGAEFELVDPEAPDGDPLLLRISEDGATWELRLGSRWADAPTLASYAASTDELGFWLDGQRLLPPRMRAGLTEEDLSVLSVESTELYYGTFPRVALIETTGGDFSGEQGFAEELGPVLLTLDGQRWELASYW